MIKNDEMTYLNAGYKPLPVTGEGDLQVMLGFSAELNRIQIWNILISRI